MGEQVMLHVPRAAADTRGGGVGSCYSRAGAGQAALCQLWDAFVSLCASSRAAVCHRLTKFPARFCSSHARLSLVETFHGGTAQRLDQLFWVRALALCWNQLLERKALGESLRDVCHGVN